MCSHADRRGGLGGHVDLGEALALEAGRERQQVRVVPLGQRGDRGGVDAAGQERADRDVGAHVLGHRVVEHVGDPVVERLLLVLGDRPDRERRVEVALGLQLAAQATVKLRAALDPADAAGAGSPAPARTAASGSAAATRRPRRRRLAAAPSSSSSAFFSEPKTMPPSASRRGEQRLDPERVAGAEQHPLLGVPDEEREHAAQPRDDVLAPLVVAGDDRLGVALGARTWRRLGGQLARAARGSCRSRR